MQRTHPKPVQLWRVNRTRCVATMGSTGDFFRARDEFRRHPTIYKNFQKACPGLGIALVAFGVYLVAETAYDKLTKPKSTSADPHHH
ncbi:hypothetical protein GOP47_0028347 [Adiantum capillus-veneris]|nr:hypothetical protein GOP47_0028347 [Adiantum capillus-veneris]